MPLSIPKSRAGSPKLKTDVEASVKELQALEAETYAEYVRSGLLNQELSPFLTVSPAASANATE